ncbi:MAG: hypothetical protein CMC18_07575 [Flavobacteriaceae bacterium]|nr:hypothetical protein [Flavobacteriaceae bacterium]
MNTLTKEIKKPGDYGEINYDLANNLISKFNDGSRLPYNDELKLIFENQDKMPELSCGDSYWSSENSTEPSLIYGKKGTAYSMTMYVVYFNRRRGPRKKCLVLLVKNQ